MNFDLRTAEGKMRLIDSALYSVRWCKRKLGRMLIRTILRNRSMNALDIIDDFVEGTCGHEYGITQRMKRALVERFNINNREIQSGTSSIIHVILAREILSISRHVKGDVVECGCWNGASTASLSLACRLTNRRLLVCDSFEGLPDDDQAVHVAPHFGIYGHYKRGMFCGRLEQVKANVEQFGAIEVCTFIKGFYNQSLSALAEPVVLAFLDVDLASSTKDALLKIWPLLVENGAIFTDDAGDLDVVRVFFDDLWWQEQFGQLSPGYIGSGCGLPLSSTYSSLGYIRKSTFKEERYKRAAHLYYPDQRTLDRATCEESQPHPVGSDR